MKKNFESTRRREYTCRNSEVRVLVTWFACRRSYLVLNSGRQMVLYESPHSFHRSFLSVYLSWTVENGRPPHASMVLIKVIRRFIRRSPEHNCLGRDKRADIFHVLYLNTSGNPLTTPKQLRLVHLNQWRDQKQLGVGPQECISNLVPGERPH